MTTQGDWKGTSSDTEREMRRCYILELSKQREEPNVLNTIYGLSNLSTETWGGHWGPRKRQLHVKVDKKG